MFSYRVGAFPICAQCNETCYENWYVLIAKERAKVVELSENVSIVLQTFNGSSVEVINQTLAELNTKLTDAEKIFNGSRFDTKTKEERYRAVRKTKDFLNFRSCSNRRITGITMFCCPYCSYIVVKNTTEAIMSRLNKAYNGSTISRGN